MRVLFPFDLMNEERWERYKPQILPIAENVDEFHILSLVQSKRFNNMNIDNIFFHCFSNKSIQFKGITRRKPIIFGLKILSYVGGIFGVFYRINLMKKYAEMSKEINPDLIYGLSGSGFMQFSYLEMKKRLNVPIIYRMRGYGVRERNIKSISNTRRITNNILDIYSSIHFDYHVPINYEFRDVLLRRNIDEKRINLPVISGVNSDKFRPLFKTTEKLIIGYAGRICPAKGIEFLTELMNKTKDLVFYIVCGEKQMEWEVPENCLYLGRIPHDEMPDIINECNIMVLPSLSEGVSNLVLESYSCAKVLLCSPYAIPEEIPNFGYKIPLNNIDDWIKIISELDFDDLHERGLKAREWAEKQSWKIFGNNMIKIFKQVVGVDY